MAGRAVHARALSCQHGPHPQQEAARVAKDTRSPHATALTIPVVHVDLKHVRCSVKNMAFVSVHTLYESTKICRRCVYGHGYEMLWFMYVYMCVRSGIYVAPESAYDSDKYR